MEIEEIKEKIDFNNIQEEPTTKMDYLMDGINYIYPLSPVEFKLIEIIKDLEARIKVLEDAEKG